MTILAKDDTHAEASTHGAEVEFRALTRRFGQVAALDGLDLAVRPGELLALLGPSGCGKTTALRVLAGFETPDGGGVFVDGADIGGVPAHRRDIGMVFQSYSLFPHLSALDNVAFGLRMRGVGGSRRRARAAELLELIGLPRHGDRFPHELSGGQQQRIALARALALRPRVLLLDEPLSALDAKVRVALREEIRNLQRELGITTLFVTHDQEEALSIADRVAVLRNGRLEQCAEPSELYDRPTSAFVAEFVGTMNRIPGRTGADGDAVEVLGQRLPVIGAGPAAAVVDVLVRPEAVRVAADPAGTSLVVGTMFLGAVTRLSVRMPEGGEVKADLTSHEAAALPAGAPVAVTLLDRPVLVDQPATGPAGPQ